MTDPEPRKKTRELFLPKGWWALHGDSEPRIASSPEKFDWRLPIIVLLFVLLVGAGVVYAVVTAEPDEPWLDLESLRVDSDEGHLYLFIETAATAGIEPEWETTSFVIGIDTYDAERGARFFPSLDHRIGSGVEFMIRIDSDRDGEVLVVQGYDPYDGENPIVSPRDERPDFVPMNLVTNRTRFTRAGRQIPEISVARGKLRASSEETPESGPRADFAVGAEGIEIRLPWALLHVSDPSSRRVLHSEEPGREEIGSAMTHGFRIYVVSVDDEDEVADAIPRSGRQAPLYRWETWETASYEMIPKKGLPLIEEAMKAIPDEGAGSSGAP